MDDASEPDNGQILRRIATLLGIPIRDLLTVDPPSPPSQEEVEALVEAFRAVRYPATRRHYLALLSAEGQPREGDAEPEDR